MERRFSAVPAGSACGSWMLIRPTAETLRKYRDYHSSLDATAGFGSDVPQLSQIRLLRSGLLFWAPLRRFCLVRSRHRKGRSIQNKALNENPTAPRFFAAMRNGTNSVFVAAMSLTRILAQALERRRP